jgi:hypothetical protein
MSVEMFLENRIHHRIEKRKERTRQESKGLDNNKSSIIILTLSKLKLSYLVKEKYIYKFTSEICKHEKKAL